MAEASANKGSADTTSGSCLSPGEEGTGITLNGGAVSNEHLHSDSLTGLCHRFAMSKLVSQSAGGARLIVDVKNHR